MGKGYQEFLTSLVGNRIAKQNSKWLLHEDAFEGLATLWNVKLPERHKLASPFKWRR